MDLVLPEAPHQLNREVALACRSDDGRAYAQNDQVAAVLAAVRVEDVTTS